MESFCPHPKQFRLVWSQEGGNKHIYIWKAVPPSEEFVALGMVATISDLPPTPSIVRCGPATWTRPRAPPWTPVPQMALSPQRRTC